MLKGMSRACSVRWIAACLTALPLAGCAGLDDARALRTDASTLRETLEADAARWRSELDAIPPDHPARGAVGARLAASEASVRALQTGIDEIDKVIAEAVKPSDPITETLSAASPLLPVPVRAPALLAAAAVVTGLRAWRLKRGLASVAGGIAAAMREDEEFRACFARHANTFRATQTPTAKRVIDEATGTRPLLSLPI